MSIPIVKGGFTEGLAKVGETIKNAALWAGRMIKTGFVKLAEAIKTLWNNALPFLKDAAVKVATFLKTAPGLALLGGLLGTVLGVTAETVNDKKHVAIALRIAAAAAFVGTGIAIGVGITNGFSTPLF